MNAFRMGCASSVHAAPHLEDFLGAAPLRRDVPRAVARFLADFPFWDGLELVAFGPRPCLVVCAHLRGQYAPLLAWTEREQTMIVLDCVACGSSWPPEPPPANVETRLERALAALGGACVFPVHNQRLLQIHTVPFQGRLVLQFASPAVVRVPLAPCAMKLLDELGCVYVPPPRLWRQTGVWAAGGAECVMFADAARGDRAHLVHFRIGFREYETRARLLRRETRLEGEAWVFGLFEVLFDDKGRMLEAGERLEPQHADGESGPDRTALVRRSGRRVWGGVLDLAQHGDALVAHLRAHIDALALRDKFARRESVLSFMQSQTPATDPASNRSSACSER